MPWSERAGGVVAVHAHPDDECLTTGGVLARAAQEGRPADVITLTGGEEGEVVGEGMDPDRVRPRLAEVRRAELACSLRELGCGPPRLLGYRDSGMAGEPSNDHPDALWRAPFDGALGALVGQLRELRPAVVVTYDAYGLYGHPDHLQAHRLGVLACEAAGEPALHRDRGPAHRVAKVYLATVPRGVAALANRELAARGLPSPFGTVTDPARLEVGTPDERVTTTVDVRDHIGRKRRALACHRSQVGPDSLFLNVPDDLAEAAFGAEWFVRLRSDVACPAHEDDLFAGLG